jgi:DNA repair exonuclease SbcCD ATPase subunit
VITHIEELKDTFDEEIHVETHKDGSRINILKH